MSKVGQTKEKSTEKSTEKSIEKVFEKNSVSESSKEIKSTEKVESKNVDDLDFGLYTGSQLKKVLEKYTLCISLNHDTEANNIEFSEDSVVKDKSFEYDPKKARTKKGFVVHDIKSSFFGFSGTFDTKTLIAEVSILDDTRIYVGKGNGPNDYYKGYRLIIVDKVHVNKIYPIRDAEIWNDDVFVVRALCEDINNLWHIKNKDTDYYIDKLEHYFNVPFVGINACLVNIIIQTGHVPKFKDRSQAKQFINKYIEWLVDEDIKYIQLIFHLTFEERHELLKENDKLKEAYDRYMLENTSFD